jgi:hypothetical protein
MNTSMASEHPFQVLFETLGRVPVAHAEPVNRQAYEILSDILTVPVEKPGRCILLRAPRAGHGKTHLLSRIQHQLGASHEFIPLQAAFGCRIDAASVTDDTLRRLVRQLPASGGLTVLDLVSRRLFASALQPLVASGEVPCQDREGALTALRNRPIETFDFHHPNAVTAHWARENFEVLGQRLSLELAHRVNLPVGAVSFWVDVLFQFAAAPLESSNRVRLLAEAAHGGGGVGMERLEALLGLLTLLMRVVLVADDLEGFSTDETAALRLAAFLGSLRQSVERLDVILSLNRDIWESAFMPRLSGGLADRLSEVVVELEPLSEMEMEALLESRVPGLGRRVLERIDVASSGTHARGLIRAAGMAWLKASAVDSTSSSRPAATAAVSAVAFTAVAPPPSPPAPPEMVVSGPRVDPAPVVPEPVAETAVVSEASPFSSTAPEMVEAGPEWPIPVFSPPVVEEMVPEPFFGQTEVESPFHAVAALETETSAPAQTVPEWQQSSPEPAPSAPPPVFENSWNPPHPAMEATPEAPIFEPRFDPSFQLTGQQIEADPSAPPFGSTGWQESATPAPPLAASLIEDFIVPVGDYAPVDSPFQNAPQPFVPDPAPYPQNNWQPPAAQPPQGIFIAPPDDETTTGPPRFIPDPPQNFPVYEPQPNFPSESVPTFQTSPEPVFTPLDPGTGVTQPPAASDTDRVDELLRQFRERYGRGSL